MFISPKEALNLMFSEEVRPSLRVFARYCRQYDLPAYHLGSRTIFCKDELEQAIRKLKHKPKH